MASKQQELDIIESWEQIEETEDIERKLNKLIPSKSLADTKTNKLNGTSIGIILTGDDALRSQYVPPEPTVKILKRPTNNQTNNDAKVFQPKKTLKEREQEYAKARLRILGEASSHEKDDEKICIQNKLKSSESENVLRQPRGPDGTKGFTIRR
ncbi:SUZ RNA-binding domain-containing [Onthophagus taurus]|uniref:SUZ RNA-binding domain-containing n=1 Tax=Onthophagus taurus TaxID=166361 RepID=UPI000C2035A3|nr:SUZ domain-containing protein 1 [Onthophagus taurus]